MNPRLLLILAVAGMCSVGLAAQAAEPLRLDEAVTRSLAAHPALQAEAAELRTVELRAERDSLPTPYNVGGELENVTGTGQLTGFRSAETTLRLSRVLELGGKQAARRAHGDAEIARRRNAFEVAKIEVASRATERYIEVAADQQRLKFANDQVALAERVRREIANWVNAARNPVSDLHAAEIALADATLDREHAEHELESARMALAANWGETMPDFDAVGGKLDELPQVDPFPVLAERLPAAAAQRTAQFDAEAIGARRRVAETSAKPDITVSLGVRRLEALDDQGLVLSASVPLGSKPRASLAIAEADAQLAALEARRGAEQLEARQELFATYQELLHARTEYEAIRSQMLPKAEAAADLTRKGFGLGRFSFVQMTQAQKTLYDLRKRSVDAAARYHALLVDIERRTAATSEATP